jgi:hypothetical protein
MCSDLHSDLLYFVRPVRTFRTKHVDSYCHAILQQGCHDSSMTGGGYVKTYVIDVDLSHTQEEGAQSPRSPGAQEP